ncbi:response regulator [soil metagenome]
MMKSTTHIMLVEDNEGDIVLAKEAFRQSKIKNILSVFEDGQKAIDFFKNYLAAEVKNFELPDLIMLDINLPKVDGKAVLKEIKTNPEFSKIPVVIFSTSNAASDIDYAYANCANCYVMKPIDLDDYMQAIKEIESFWFKTVQLPTS